MATAHLLHCFAGAGKTTFARKLEKELGAVRFTYDEWMHRLYGPNPPADSFDDYLCRISSLIWDYVEVLLRLDRDVILDSAFWSRASRDETRDRLRSIGAEYNVNGPTCCSDISPIFMAASGLSCWTRSIRLLSKARSLHRPCDCLQRS